MPDLRSLVVIAITSCATPPAIDPCVGAEALGDPVIDSAVAPGAVGQWWSSEAYPFDLEHPDTIWFECPRPIAHELERMPDLAFDTMDASAAGTVIDIDPATMFQTILGTGISMEAASVANLQALGSDLRHEALVRMFDPVRGMGLQLVRVTIGTSDFASSSWYTYDDLPAGSEDPQLTAFTIDRDRQLGILDVLREIRAIAPDVRFFASPWSPPAWMKDGGRITGGALRTDRIAVYAAYLRRFVEAYRDEGVPIAALTLQNEPRSDDDQMPSCLVTAEQEAALATAVAAEFTSAQLATQVWAYDHNFDAVVDYATDVLRDPAARAVISAVALHDYAGDPSAMTAVHEQFPGLDVVFTEKTLWGVAGVDRVAQYFRNWSRSYVSWLAMLDQDGAPNPGPNSLKPRRFVRSLRYSGAAYYATPEHYLFGLYSRFVQVGATRIASSPGSSDTVTDVAFANPDGTIAVVVINQSDRAQAFALRSAAHQLVTSLDAKTAATYLWHASP
ncbi:MAG TPA: glycoside hydrolase family 30 beta sandwich domain-containing protein [Kofleriaceae bacterium]|nr:glycoside hydrolase family 30 beta sandwich domain-containing protein [Kofleriaceae bacterium]